MIDFEKAFFSTKEDKQRQVNLLNKLHTDQIQDYVTKGLSIEEAEKRIEKDVKEFKSRDYYS